MKAFVTGAGALLGQGIIRSLKLAPTDYYIVAADPDPRAVGLYWADCAYLIPLASDPRYLEEVRRILTRERPDVVLIGTDVELLTFALHRSALEQELGTHVIVSSPPVVRVADDKWLTYEFLRDNGFPHPRSTLPGDLPAFLGRCDFPLVVKPRIGARSSGVSVVKNERELRAALAAVENPIVQECVATPEEEFTSGVVVAGDVKAVVTMRRDLRDGNTYRAYVGSYTAYDDQLTAVASRLEAFGPLNLQFRVAEGIPKVFEINARFSGTTPLRALAGFNEVDAIVRHVVRDEPIQVGPLRPCTILRYWSESVVESDQIVQLARTGTLGVPRSVSQMPS